MGKQGRTATPTLDTLSAGERAEVLRRLLDGHPRLAAEAEEVAAALLGDEDRGAVAEDVASTLRSVPCEDVWARAGRDPSYGYVQENEAAWMVLEDELEPFVEDLRRRARLGMERDAVELGMGIVQGLYACRDDADNGIALAWAPAPDFTGDQAASVLEELRAAGLA
ncbi:MAG: hypothetical protein ACRDU8_06795, partial [Egibacteraceae bacterium]